MRVSDERAAGVSDCASDIAADDLSLKYGGCEKEQRCETKRANEQGISPKDTCMNGRTLARGMKYGEEKQGGVQRVGDSTTARG